MENAFVKSDIAKRWRKNAFHFNFNSIPCPTQWFTSFAFLESSFVPEPTPYDSPDAVSRVACLMMFARRGKRRRKGSKWRQKVVQVCSCNMFCLVSTLLVLYVGVLSFVLVLISFPSPRSVLLSCIFVCCPCLCLFFPLPRLVLVFSNPKDGSITCFLYLTFGVQSCLFQKKEQTLMKSLGFVSPLNSFFLRFACFEP